MNQPTDNHESLHPSLTPSLPQLLKCPTGIDGLDEITFGGLPGGRPTLVCGSAGCGKTLLAMEFLVRGATRYGETGVFVAFEETIDELVQNVASLGFDLKGLIEQKQLALDHVQVERHEIEETGEYDLEGLFIRLGYAIDSIGAKRVVLDTIESLLSGLSDATILRAELRRLFRWLKEKGVTTIITGERGDGMLTRQGLEEYVSDCVILLEQRVLDEVTTRRMRIIKYRGSLHGTNEYPFLISEAGITVLPVTSLGLAHAVSSECISTGIERLDDMLGGVGYYRGSSVLVTGTAGTGKTSLAAHFLDATCRRGETCLVFALEESRDQMVRNMRSIGIDLQPWIEQGNLVCINTRPTLYGLETHLAVMHRHVLETKPSVVVIDPISSLLAVGTISGVHAMLTRLVDFLKERQITSLFTDLTATDRLSLETTGVGISSVMDVWLLLRDLETVGERNRGLYVIKSRGMGHSNQIREFVLTDHGVELRDVYLGMDGVLTGSARIAQEARDRATEMAHRQEAERQRTLTQRRRASLEAQIVSLQAEIAMEETQLNQMLDQESQRSEQSANNRAAMARFRLSKRSLETAEGVSANYTKSGMDADFGGNSHE